MEGGLKIKCCKEILNRIIHLTLLMPYCFHLFCWNPFSILVNLFFLWCFGRPRVNPGIVFKVAQNKFCQVKKYKMQLQLLSLFSALEVLYFWISDVFKFHICLKMFVLGLFPCLFMDASAFAQSIATSFCATVFSFAFSAGHGVDQHERENQSASAGFSEHVRKSIEWWFCPGAGFDVFW